MSMRPPKKKKKKNPYRLSSDRQPGITKANKPKKKKKSIKDLLDKIGKIKPKTGPIRKMPPGGSKLKGNINKQELKIITLKPGQKIYDKDGNLLN
jgi:hypothetical protein